MQHIKKILTLISLMFLIFASLPITASASGSFKTDLVDGLVTKSERLTFDLWAKDAYGNKIEATDIEVLNNNKIVPVNWDDKEKTSYTLTLDVGINTVTITHPSQKLTYKITRQYANDGDVIGHFVFSLDAFTLGQGYIIEPIEVPIIKGRNSAQELDGILSNHGFDYKSTGTLENGFYLATIYSDALFQKQVIVPDALKTALKGVYDETLYAKETGLGEFDINYMSGWMYSVNNVFPNVGFADKYMLDRDVMRVQFTLAYGQDIGGGEAMGGDGGSDFYPKVNKDELTRKMAAINTPGKNLYLINSTRINAYKQALQVLQKVNASQSEIDAALRTLQLADQATQSDGSVYKEDEVNNQPSPTPAEPPTNTEDRQQANRVTSQIQVLPSVNTITLADAPAVYLARQNYNALSATAKSYVTNVDKLEQAELQIKRLQGDSNIVPSTNLADAQNVMNTISSLPAQISLADEKAILNARKSYDALTSERKLLIMNYSMLLLAEMTLSSLKEENSSTQAKILQTVRLINAIPANISVKDKVAIQEARASYDQLSAAEKGSVTNYNKLLNAETSLKLVLEQNQQVQQLQLLIDELPKNLTKQHQTTLENILKQYNALTATQQKEVSGIQRIKDTLNALANGEAINPSFIIKDEVAKITASSNDISISNEQLQQIIKNTAIQKLEITNKSGSTFTVNKEYLPKSLKGDALMIEEQLIKIGANKELIINVKDNEQPLQMPIQLQLSLNDFKNGYLLQKNKNELLATPHYADNQFLNATINSNQAYVYTTNTVTFNDLKNDAFADDIYYLANRYVVKGANGNYNSKAPISRANFAVMIARAMNATPKTTTEFKDIKGKSYEQAVQALYELEIINGVSNTQFNPSADLSREHAAIIMARVLRHAGLKQPTTYSLQFKDVDKINPKYRADIAWLEQLGIMSGSNDSFNPKNKLTRGQMAKILKRTLNTAKIM